MKTLVLSLMATICVAQSASAEVMKKACTSKDYQVIDNALNNEEIRSGRKLKKEILGVLAEEMGPVCNQLIEMEIKMGIPGNDVSDYELVAGQRRYQITIIDSMESGEVYSILKKN